MRLAPVPRINKQTACCFSVPKSPLSMRDKSCLAVEQSRKGRVSTNGDQVANEGKLNSRPYIMDLESTNGTYLNGKRIEPSRYYELREGDELRFGYSTRSYILLNEHSVDVEIEEEKEKEKEKEKDELDQE